MGCAQLLCRFNTDGEQQYEERPEIGTRAKRIVALEPWEHEQWATIVDTEVRAPAAVRYLFIFSIHTSMLLD